MSPKHYTNESHAHYLTFSCYKNLWLFKDDILNSLFVESLNQAHSRSLFSLYGFVIMPNHVHLLIYPLRGASISAILTAIKQPFSHRALNYIGQRWPEMDGRLRIRKGDSIVRRFWQAGGGYDRNIYRDETFVHTLEYMHENPLRKGLVKKASDWK